MELVMSETQDIEQDSFIQKWGPHSVAAILAGAVALYLSQFDGEFSKSQDTWGQFGDFVGGAVNPIIGFFTILLLSVSLRQNNKALSQARQELTLTRRAVEDARLMQESTEAALKAQTDITANARDMNNAISLYQELDRQYVGMGKALDADSELLPENAEYIAERVDHMKLIESQRYLLGAVLSIETARLIKTHCPQSLRAPYESEKFFHQAEEK